MLTALFVLPLAGQDAASRKVPPARHAGRSQVSNSPDWPAGQLVYENGPINGTVGAWTINNSFVVSDSFTVTNGGVSINELSFGAWLSPGSTLQSAEVSLTSAEFGGTSFFDQTVNFTQIGCTANQQGANVCLVSGAFTGVNLNTGTYWVNLQNATTGTPGQPVYWDENSGVGCQSGGCPSQASENGLGTIPSEAFTLSSGSAIATTTSLSAPGSATAGQAVTLAATVQAQGGFPVGLGSVTFLGGNQVLGTVQVSSSTPGSATLLTRFGPGSYSLTAQYNGNDFLLGSTSTAQPLTVTGTEPTTGVLTVSNYNFTLNVTGSGNSALSGTGALENVTQGLMIGTIPVPLPSTSTFSAALSYAANNGPQGIVAGDFNGDGIPDLAITNNSSTTVSVLLGKAQGGFQPPVTYNVGSAPVGIVAWDFNGDGILDLAVANSQGVSVLLGKGDGTFQPQNLITLGFGTSPWAVAVADFNGDGKADLAVTDANNGVVRILLGNGDGTFNVEDMQTEVGTDPVGVAVGDFNGDGLPDLAVTNFGSASGTNGLSILLGNGDGTFQTQVNYTTGKAPQGVAVGDFRGNGILDLAVANLNDDTVGIFLGNGDGTFQSQVPYATGSLPYGVAVADFNGDGKADLAVSDSDDPSKSAVTVLLGNGDGTFEAQPDYTVGANPNGLVVADFNGDGAPDIATANNGDNRTSILLTQTTNSGTLNNVVVYGIGAQTIDGVFTPDGTFYGGDISNTVIVQGIGLAPTTTSVGGVPNPSTYLETVVFTVTVTSVAGSPTGTVTFLDGSTPIPGCSDLVLTPGSGDESTATCSTTTVPAGSNCITASYSGGGIFAASQSPCFTQTVNQAATTTTLIANPPSPSTYGEQVMFTATVTGENGGSPTGTVSFTANQIPIAGCTAVPVNPQTNTATCTTKTLLGGSYTIAGAYSGDTNFLTSSGSIPYQVQSIATTTTLTVSPPNGGVGTVVTLTASVTIPAGPVNAGTVTFMNGQQVFGVVQVVASNGTATLKLRVPPGTYSFTANFNGTDSFQSSQSSPQPYNETGTEPTQSTLTAMQDGNNYDFGLSVFGFGFPSLAGAATLNNLTQGGSLLGTNSVAGPGMPTFQPPQAFGTGSDPQEIIVGDFNGDGFPDLAITNFGGQTVGILLGNGDGTFQPQQTYATSAQGPTGIAAGDFTGNGKLDLVVTMEATSGGGVADIFLGNGDGTFQPATTIPNIFNNNYFLKYMALADYNGDGYADLAITGDAGVTILLGQGDGTFNVLAPVTGNFFPIGIAEGDFNGDGIPDLVVAPGDTSQVLTILLGNGDGTFQVLSTMPQVGNDAYKVAAGDFNHDGKLDLATANEADGTVSVLLGKGDGTFKKQVTYPVCTQPFSIVVADFNGDGKPDLAVTCENNMLNVLLGNGDGTFQAAQPYSMASGTIGLAVGDFNGDGVPDLAATTGNETTSVLLGGILSTGTLNNIPVPGVGNQNIQASFTPTGTFYGASLSNIVTVSGNGEIPTTTVVTSSLNPSTYLRSVTFTATVTSMASELPTGTVTFTADGNVICPDVPLVPTSNGATATCQAATLLAGSHSIVASYSGNTQFAPSQSQPLTEVVNRAATTTSITSTPNPSMYLQTVTITATVIGANGGSPTQTVNFTDNGNAIPGCGAVALTAQTNGSVAICQTTTLSIGTHSQIVATYSGDNNYSGGSGTLRPAQVVEAASTTIVIKSSQNPSISMQPVTFTATVMTASGAPASGQVTFQSNGVNIPDCTNPATLVNGVASCITQSLAVGSDTILASFNDPQGRYGSSSATLIQTVQATRTDFTIAPISPDTATVTQSFTNLSDPFFPHAINLAVQPLNGYNNTVNLSCSVSPPLTGGVCSVNSPSSGVVDGNLNTTLTITTASVTPVGIYTVTVTGQDNSGLVHTATLTLSVINYATGVSMPPGGGATTTITFPGTAGTPIGSFTCSLVNGTGLAGNQPLGAIGGNCVFSPPSGVIPGPIQVTISGCEIARLRSHIPIYASFFLGLPGIVLLGSLAGGRRRKTLISIVGICLVASALLLGVGCGGYGPLTPTGNYLVLVQGSSPAGTVYSAVVPVTVKPLN
jgi:hypothetical protein